CLPRRAARWVIVALERVGVPLGGVSTRYCTIVYVAARGCQAFLVPVHHFWLSRSPKGRGNHEAPPSWSVGGSARAGRADRLPVLLPTGPVGSCGRHGGAACPADGEGPGGEVRAGGCDGAGEGRGPERDADGRRRSGAAARSAGAGVAGPFGDAG